MSELIRKLTWGELRAMCKDRITNDIAHIDLFVDHAATSRTTRLFGRSGPRGKVLCVSFLERTAARFTCKSLLDYMDADTGGPHSFRASVSVPNVSGLV